MLEHIKTAITNWHGSSKTAESIREEVRKRWGDEVAKEYDPTWSARPYSAWRKLGFQVKKGETALRSITAVETKDSKGKVVSRHFRPVFLFHYKQLDFEHKQ